MNSNTKKIFTIPNILSLFRLALIPLIVWLYVGKGTYLGTLAILALSAATDIIDGRIARKYNLVTDFGKALDPVADKLTQLTMLACLVSRFPKILWLFILLAVKECMTGIMSLLAIRKSNTVLSSEWHGKLTTVLLYATMMIHLLWYNIPGWLSNGLITLCAIVMAYSAARYFIRNIRQISKKEYTHDPQTGEETIIEGFDFVWQIIGSVSSTGGDAAAMEMDLVAMCNINLLYFGIAVLVSLFVSNDFRSGYCKNLFAVRSKKSDYIISKTIICVIASMLLLVGFFLGSLIGGAIAGLPFTMEGFNAGNLVMCLLSKLLLTAVFVPIYLLGGVIAKSKTWLGMVLSFAIGMLLFTMIPMISPLDANLMNVILCAAGGAAFSVGLGSASKAVLNKKDIL